MIMKNESGQMTVEYAVMFPVMLAIALVACNAILFFSECASFDRIFRESVCVFAPSPASGETSVQTSAQVVAALQSFEERSYLSCAVEASGHGDGLTTYSATLFFTPTIFGAYDLHGAFGVTFSPIEHRISLTVDTYKPGVFL